MGRTTQRLPRQRQSVPYMCGGGPDRSPEWQTRRAYSLQAWGWTEVPANRSQRPSLFPTLGGDGPIERCMNVNRLDRSLQAWGWTDGFSLALQYLYSLHSGAGPNATRPAIAPHDCSPHSGDGSGFGHNGTDDFNCSPHFVGLNRSRYSRLGLDFSVPHT
jgi:hypothetical protein